MEWTKESAKKDVLLDIMVNSVKKNVPNPVHLDTVMQTMVFVFASLVEEVENVQNTARNSHLDKIVNKSAVAFGITQKCVILRQASVFVRKVILVNIVKNIVQEI